MADMVTRQELEAAKVDVKHAGEAVNTKKVITPRYGQPFNSFPLELENLAKAIQVALAAGAGAAGWIAELVVDGDKTQKQINASLNKDSSLSIESGFSKNNADNVVSFLQFQKALSKFEPNSEISIEKPITIDLTGSKSSIIDLQGATLNFKTGGKLTFKGKTTQYLTTNVTTDLIRGATYFQVASTAGIAKGDLILVKSPVVIAIGITLVQTYLVQGVDSDTSRIYVMGTIAGDIRADQITAQGLTGSITMECYKTAKSLTVINGTTTSIDRDDETTEILVDGFKLVNLSGLTPDRPTRTGININYCGIVNIDKCLINDVGYVTNDQGYNSVPTSPGGLSFGYGFLASYCYCVNFFNNHVLAGWHGIDVARGVTFANAYGNTLHKGSFGISSHEGQSVLNVFMNSIFGGHAVTSRSFELLFKGNVGRGIKERLIIGSQRMQSLIIDGNDIEMSQSFPTNFIYFDGAFPVSCFSNAEPVAKVSNNNIRGLSTSNVLTIWKNLDIDNNNFSFNGVNIACGALVNTGVLNIRDNKHSGIVQQSVYNITSQFAEVNIQDEDDKTTASLSNSALLYASVALPKVNLISNKSRNKSFLVRNPNNSVINFNDVIDNKVFDGRTFDWTATNSRVERYLRNITKDDIPAANVVTYVTQKDNIVLSRAYSASKIHDWGSLAAGLTQSTTLNLLGALLGDNIVPSMNINLSGTRLWAEVTANGQVTVYQNNPTAVAVDLSSGTLTIKLI